MAFEKFKGFFGRTEDIKQPEDVLTTLSAEHRNTLNVLRDALQRNGNLTGEQIGALSFVKDALRDSVGEAAMEAAIAIYFKEQPEPRLGELKEIVSRQDFLRAKLMQSMADVDKSATVETLAALDRAKSSLRVLSPETFTSKDVEDLCAELKDSEEYTDFISQRIAAAAPSVAAPADRQYAPGVAPTLPKQTPHNPIGMPNTKWTPPTADDTLHAKPPTHLMK